MTSKRTSSLVTPNYRSFLWLLKVGCLANLWFLARMPSIFAAGVDLRVLVPAQILVAVSAYRCLFPVRYEGNVVLHEGLFSSIFATRLLATFSEIAYIYLFSHVLRLLNAGNSTWIIALSWLMVVQVVISQVFVWIAILTERLEFYFHEEFGWAIIFLANTIASVILYVSQNPSGERAILIGLNLVFGALYLPWQMMHLKSLRANAQRSEDSGRSTAVSLYEGLHRSMTVTNRRTDAQSWGGAIGLSWMIGYWATLIPAWVYYIAKVLSFH